MSQHKSGTAKPVNPAEIRGDPARAARDQRPGFDPAMAPDRRWRRLPGQDNGNSAHWRLPTRGDPPPVFRADPSCLIQDKPGRFAGFSPMWLGLQRRRVFSGEASEILIGLDGSTRDSGLVSPRSWRMLSRARFSLLLMVPTAQLQMSAASS